MAERLSSDSPLADLARRTAVVLGVATLFLLGWLLLREALYYVLLLFAGVLFCLFLHGLAKLLQGWTGMPHAAALALVTLLFFGILGALAWFIGPRVGAQLGEVVDRVPRAVEQARTWLSQREWGSWLLERAPSAEDMAGSGGGGEGQSGEGGGGGLAAQIATRLTRFLMTIGSVLSNALVVAFLGIYLAIDPHRYVDGGVRLLPRARRPRATEVLEEIGHALQSWLTGRFATMVVTGTFTWAALWLIGVPLSLALGVIAGLFAFVPIIGPIAASIPGIAIAFTESPQLALFAALAYFAAQSLESYIITPLIQEKVVSLPPPLLLSAQILLGVAVGIWGILLAPPIAVMSMVLVQMLWIQDALGEDVEIAG